MSTWSVDVRGERHQVSFQSPMLGKKTIFVDGEAIRDVGSTISMWGNYDFDIHGEPATIKFRAIKSMKGMSLFVNGEKIEPNPENAEMSAETVGMVMIGVLVMIAGTFAFGILQNS